MCPLVCIKSHFLTKCLLTNWTRVRFGIFMNQNMSFETYLSGERFVTKLTYMMRHFFTTMILQMMSHSFGFHTFLTNGTYFVILLTTGGIIIYLTLVIFHQNLSTFFTNFLNILFILLSDLGLNLIRMM